MWCFGCSGHLRGCPRAWHHTHSWWAASQLVFLENENLKSESMEFVDVPALDPDQSFLRGWPESPRGSGLQVEPQPKPGKLLFPLLQNTQNFVGKFNNTKTIWWSRCHRSFGEMFPLDRAKVSSFSQMRMIFPVRAMVWIKLGKQTHWTCLMSPWCVRIYSLF